MSSISSVGSSGDAWANMKAQRSQMQAKMFAKVDADNSGGVDKTELKNLLSDVASKTGVSNSSSSDELFTKLDANSDGSLTSDELGQGMQSIMPPPPSTMEFAQSRTESNGNLSEAEAARTQGGEAAQGGAGPQAAGGMPPPPPPGAASGTASNTDSSTSYDELDTNQDGTVSLSERLAGSASSAVDTLLQTIDSNNDQQISEAETGAFMEKLSAQLESGKTTDGVDLAELVTQAYEQIANAATQQTTGSTLSAVV
ncbi:MAG: calcium-binding EF-hand-like protein [Comamonadaceae bacterium]|nr:MAG: calcium-binding EF-hand-like protein [Comamonadaceae bacterium]